MALTGGLFGVHERVVPPPQGGALAPPANVNLFNIGGPSVATGNQAAAITNVVGIQWDNVSGSTGFDVIRVDAETGGTTTLATNIQPVTFTGTQSGTTLTVTGATAGTVLPGVRWSAPGLASGAMIDQPQLTGSGNGNGTYHMNTSQTLGPVTFTANIYVDSAATNATRPYFDSASTGYWYQVGTRQSGVPGSFSTNMTYYQYQNGYSNVSNSDLSFGSSGSANYASTNGSPLSASGLCTEIVFVNYGWQPTAMAMSGPQWTINIQWAGYFFININPGSNPSVPMYMGPPPCRTTEGDVFSWNNPQAVNLFSTAYGPTVVANTWSRRKVPCALLALCCNPFAGSISGSTLTVSSVGNDLFGNTGRVDNGGWITGPGISVPAYIHASGQGGSIGTFTVYTGTPAPPDNGTPVSITASSTGQNWTYRRYDEYKFALNPGGQPLTGSVYVGDWGFTRT